MAPKAPDRVVTTCRECRRRKVGCDRQRPACRQCTASNITCVYENSRGRAFHFVHEGPSASSGQQATATQPYESETDPSVAVSEDRIAALELRVQSLSDLLKTVRQSSSSGTSPFPPSTHEDDRTGHPGPVGYLSNQGGGKLRYVNLSSWSSICRDAAGIDDILFSQSQGSSTYGANTGLGDDIETYLNPTSTEAAQASAIGSGSRSATGISLSVSGSIWAQFPSKEMCDSVLIWYFRGYHPLIPLVHVPSFRKEYDEFWTSFQGPDSGRAALISFATMLLSFLYAGCVVNEDPEDQVLQSPTAGHENIATYIYRLTAKALRLAKFPHAPTLNTLRAYLILKSIQMREEEPLSCVAFVGLSVRVANMLGLHKDPKRFPEVGPIDAEVRRRIWWQLIHIDVCVAVAAGLPPLIDLYSWDVHIPSEVKDEYIGTPAAIQYDDEVRSGKRPASTADTVDQVAPSMVSAAGILAASKLYFTFVQRRFLQRLETGSIANDGLDVRRRFEELGTQLQQAIDRVPELEEDEARGKMLTDSYQNNSILNRWARLLISTYLDQRLCLMSYPLMHFSNWQGWEGLHNDTVEACMSFLVKCAALSTDSAYRQFQWSWPGNHQPLHAMVILLNELSSSSDLSSASRIGNVVDVVFTLAYGNTGLVGSTANIEAARGRSLTKGGGEVWQYLRRLRARTWRNLGWDPAVSWSRAQAISLTENWLRDMSQVGRPVSVDREEAQLGLSDDFGRAPSTDLFGDEFLYAADFDLQDFGSGINILGEGDQSWFNDL